MTRHIATGAALVLGLFIVITLVFPAGFQHAGVTPHPGLLPQQVVGAQLQALRGNTAAGEGIAVAYRFASAANQSSVGPLSHFARMLKSDDYAPLLGHLSVEFGPTAESVARSYVPVVVTDSQGRSSAFVWVLSRSSNNRCGTCWMIDAVLPAGQLHRLRFA